MKNVFTIALALAISFPLFAQDKEKEEDKWDVSTPTLPFDSVSITTEEGTWMSLDVSPDGSEIVFDLLGDIYTLPISGGEAKLIKGLIRNVFAGKTVIIIEHDIAFVRSLDALVTVLHRGQVLLEGSFDEIAADEAVRRIYLGEEI